jgi:hypothetical protein
MRGVRAAEARADSATADWGALRHRLTGQSRARSLSAASAPVPTHCGREPKQAALQANSGRGRQSAQSPRRPSAHGRRGFSSCLLVVCSAVLIRWVESCLARSWWTAACIVIGSFKDIRHSSDELRGWWKRRWRARSRASTSRPRRSTPSRRHSKAVIRANLRTDAQLSTAGRIAAVPCLLRKSKRRDCTTYLCTTCCRSRAWQQAPLHQPSEQCLFSSSGKSGDLKPVAKAGHKLLGKWPGTSRPGNRQTRLLSNELPSHPASFGTRYRPGDGC